MQIEASQPRQFEKRLGEQLPISTDQHHLRFQVAQSFQRLRAAGLLRSPNTQTLSFRPLPDGRRFQELLAAHRAIRLGEHAHDRIS